jgi:hypothetical protein
MEARSTGLMSAGWVVPANARSSGAAAGARQHVIRAQDKLNGVAILHEGAKSARTAIDPGLRGYCYTVEVTTRDPKERRRGFSARPTFDRHIARQSRNRAARYRGSRRRWRGLRASRFPLRAPQRVLPAKSLRIVNALSRHRLFLSSAPQISKREFSSIGVTRRVSRRIFIRMPIRRK